MLISDSVKRTFVSVLCSVQIDLWQWERFYQDQVPTRSAYAADLYTAGMWAETPIPELTSGMGAELRVGYRYAGTPCATNSAKPSAS